ncbi:putative HVA22-like protein g [Neltuma alba]|uniref:putative HVA22-like protein g n=1 Tax=Neltuma alba TaxID=207710 RepID=UPI0010A47BC0|nr:putative HVA22-like protein g [Prosopis alba]
MLGDFLTRILILLLGYAYPGFECYKTVEKNRVQIEELRFWCQYWIIVAIVTVLERFTDIFVGWLPLYGEMKVAFFVYLWYPKTKGTGFVYQTVLRPVVARHENEIDKQLMELKASGRDLVAHYWQISAKMGHSAFFQGLEYLATQSIRLKATPPPQVLSQFFTSFHFLINLTTPLFPINQLEQIAPIISTTSTRQNFLHHLLCYLCVLMQGKK